MKFKVRIRSLVALTILSLSAGAAFANATSDIKGESWTRCTAREIEYRYDFKGYISTLTVGDTIKVYNSLSSSQSFGSYRVDYLDLRSGQVGTVKLSPIPNGENDPSNAINFGAMKIEYFSIFALKDIKVTFTKDGIEKTSWVTCEAN